MPKTPFVDGEKKPWNLVPLTPKYIENEHGKYVDAILEALKDPAIRNIALSGSYGIGKSSILGKVAEKNRRSVVELSLSSLATTEESVQESSISTPATTTTNRIQQEIVKQLLYSESSKRTPNSRFQRIEQFNWIRELPLAFIISFVFMLTFLLTGWTAEIANEFFDPQETSVWSHLTVLSLTTFILFTFRYLYFGRVRIKQFSAGAAVVTLDEKSISYFDQYLDEIVYFFDVTKIKIAIFEDIDRFENTQIFETLRALNTLVNSPKKNKDPIRFIYAIRDGIFDQSNLPDMTKNEEKREISRDHAQVEMERSNRTKFFDLVIPVVPFITHRSAKNVVSQLLADIDHEIDTKLIDLASRYVPDMRLLKNARNEFIVFHDRIFSGDGEALQLSKSELFAMMLYKSTHLTDFELIRHGNSKLDRIYKLSRDLVAANIQRLRKEIGEIQQYLSQVDGLSEDCAKFGKLLLAHVTRTARAASYSVNLNGSTFTVNERDFNVSDVSTVIFWSELMSASIEATLRWRNGNGQKLIFLLSDLSEALGIGFDARFWENNYRERLMHNLSLRQDNIKFLRGADMSDLLTRGEFLVEDESSTKSLDEIARELLADGLAFQLISTGYVNRNFTLYTSTFHGTRVSTAATNFLIHHYERNAMDEYFKLEAKDVAAVIHECGHNALSESALYNISILDYLLQSDKSAADIMIKSILQFGSEESRFFQAFVTSTNEQALFSERLVMATSKALIYLISHAELPDDARVIFVDSALRALADEFEYELDPSVKKFLEDNFENFSSLTSVALSGRKASNVAEVFSNANIKLPALSVLTDIVRREFVKRNLYEVGKENLTFALGVETDLSLDSIRRTDKDIYNYVLQNLGLYLAAIRESYVSVSADFEFTSIIHDVLSVAPEYLEKVIQVSDDACRVVDLSVISEKAWPLLAEHCRFPATFGNVLRYIDSVGELDAHIAKILVSAGQVLDLASAEEVDKERVALEILSASEHIPSALVRVDIVKSLDLEEYLSADDLPVEGGDLYAMLIVENIVCDDAETYSRMLTIDWPTREHFIEVSSEFKNYVSPALLKGDLGALLNSSKISHESKVSVVATCEQYFPGSRKSDLNAVAKFAALHAVPLSLEVVNTLAANNARAEDIVVLLAPHLRQSSLEEIRPILQLLGAQYIKLLSPGYDVAKIPDSKANRDLLDALRLHGIVTKYLPANDKSSLHVYKKHK